MKHQKILTLCEGAMSVALAFALGYVNIPTGGFGGSISLCMLPLALYALRRGWTWGMGAGLVYGLIDFLTGGLGVTWQSIILDYLVAYALVGVAGCFPGHPVIGTVLGGVARYVALVLSGVFIWGEYMHDLEFFGHTLKMTNVWVYSLVYNIQYMLPSIVIVTICIAILKKTTKLVVRQG